MILEFFTIFDIEGGTQTEAVREQGADENIWTESGEVKGSRSKLHNEEFHNLYSSPHIIRMIKSRRMRWVGHVE
jgi:hypothetical protein